MTGLVRHAVDTCFAFNIHRIYVDASICARPLFEKAGFKVTRKNIVTINGVDLLNFKMELLRGTQREEELAPQNWSRLCSAGP
jgi:putative acetyltransferase